MVIIFGRIIMQKQTLLNGPWMNKHFVKQKTHFVDIFPFRRGRCSAARASEKSFLKKKNVVFGAGKSKPRSLCSLSRSWDFFSCWDASINQIIMPCINPKHLWQIIHTYSTYVMNIYAKYLNSSRHANLHAQTGPVKGVNVKLKVNWFRWISLRCHILEQISPAREIAACSLSQTWDPKHEHIKVS